jgi:dephospho-CoA kinase
MIQLGITGGIGSGKSTVCKVLEHFGIPVYYADEEAKKILDLPFIQKKVIAAFGSTVKKKDGHLDRQKIASIVFADKEKLKQLNAIVHPEVAKQYNNWLKSKSKSQLLAKEAAILFESGSYSQMNKIISVYAPKELRIKRAMQRDKVTREEVLMRMKKQLSEKEKMMRSDFILLNNEKKLLLPQIISVLKKLKYHI